MTHRGVVGFLWRLGRGLARDSLTGTMRRAALVVRSAALGASLIALVLGLASAADRQEQTNRLLPVPAESSASATALYARTLVSITDGAGVERGVFVAWVQPLSADVPPPPGVQRWPGPGEAVVSPQLRRDLATHPADLFGSVVGTIAPAGLEVATERRVYIGPTALARQSSKMMPIRGFGTGGAQGLWGFPTLDAGPTWQLMMGLVGLLVLPALVGLSVASGLGAEARLSRTRQLTAMGAGRGHIALLDLAEAWPALAIGTAVAGAALVVLGVTGLTLSPMDTQLTAGQVRGWWPQALMALLGAHLLAVAVLLGSRLARRSRFRIWQRSPRQQVQRTRALACVGAGVAAIVIPSWSQSSLTRTVAYNLAVIIVVLTLPALLATMLVAVGEPARRWGTTYGSPAALLAGSRLSGFPVRTARLTAGAAAALLLFGQVQLNASTLGEIYQIALDGRIRYGDVAISAGQPADSPGLRSFLDKLGPDTAPIWVWVDYGNGTRPDRYNLVGSCQGLAALGQQCVPATSLSHQPANKALSAVSADVGLASAADIRITPQPRPDLARLSKVSAQLYLVSVTGADLALDALRREAFLSTTGTLRLATIGNQWVAAETPIWIRQRWVVLWGLLGAGFLLAAVSIVLAAEVLTSARETSPLAALSDRRRWLLALAAWWIWLPLALTGLVAATAYWILPTSMSDRLGTTIFFTPSPVYAWASALIGIGMGLILALSSARTFTHASHRWRPGIDIQSRRTSA